VNKIRNKTASIFIVTTIFLSGTAAYASFTDECDSFIAKAICMVFPTDAFCIACGLS